MLRTIVRLLLAALFLFAGTVHLRNPELFLPVMPPWIPFHVPCILVSGVFELLGGIGLLVPLRPVQFVTGWGLTLLLIAVFPANIYMAVDNIRVHGFPSHPWMGWARLPLQPLFMAGVLWVTRTWPGICNIGVTTMPNIPKKIKPQDPHDPSSILHPPASHLWNSPPD